MWYEIYTFEIRYRLRRPDTYIFFLFLFLFSIAGVDFIFQGADLGPIKKNAPLVIAKTMGAISGIFMILASMIMGVPVIRDFQYNMASLVFVNPIKKHDYLLGRFFGSFTILLLIFCGIPLGMILGEFLPWHKPEDLLPLNTFNYFKIFTLIVLPILLFGASLFFVTGMLSKKLVVVYTQGIILFVVFMLTKAIEHRYLQAILDPFSLTTLTFLSETWSLSDRSLRSIPFGGVLLYNKLFWSLLGVVVFVFGYIRFKLQRTTDKKHKKKTIPEKDAQLISLYSGAVPPFVLNESFKSKWIQFVQLSRFYFISICKQPSFWAIVICGMIIILINSVNLGTVYGVDSYPATYFIVEELQEMSIYFFVIILIFYSGELVWKERSVHLSLIHDATSISDFIRLASKYVGLILIYIILMVSLILSGIIFQTIQGYYDYKLQVYLYGFFIEILPFLALYTLVAFFIHSLLNHKFVGILVVLVFFILTVTSGVLGYDHVLYAFAGNSLGTYSDMNAYGHFLQPYLFVKTYWFLFGILLLIAGSVISARGTETNLVKRWKASKSRVSKNLLRFATCTTIAFTALGSYIFYNTNILNDYWSRAEQTSYRVSYEKDLKQFEYKLQPKITDVTLKVDLYPKLRSYRVKGSYVLKNKHNIAIDEVHIQKLIASHVSVDSVVFDRKATEIQTYKNYYYTIYKLAEPLKPGDSIEMNFVQTLETKGFTTGNPDTDMVYNGTFLNNTILPSIGYNRKYELKDNDDREDYNLPVRLIKKGQDNPHELKVARTGSDADQINFEIIVGTDIDQTAIAPGNLLKHWVENKRNYYHYKMEEPIINFYSIVSAKYDTKKDSWAFKNSGKVVDLEIYYHQEHTYNIDRMMNSMKKSLDYFSKHFSPYQYEQLRIMEFPRYAEFAQSFPGTIPFSEAIGFVLDIDDKKDVDMAFYVTAHEVAHQWWGMQVEAANVQGQNFILETLAQYSALMVLKENYPKEKVEQFLEIQLEAYKKGKKKEKKQELSLALVENQEYIYYNKGAINMFRLQEQIGEDKVNLALKQFIKDWNSKDGNIKTKTKRYTTSNDLLGYFRKVTPDSLQYLIYDLFQKVE